MNPAPQLKKRKEKVKPIPKCWFYVYLLRGKAGGIYIGCTADIDRRLQEHREGKNCSTKKILPVELVYFEAYKSSKDAFEREKHLKYYGSALRNLKLRLPVTLKQGGAG